MKRLLPLFILLSACGQGTLWYPTDALDQETCLKYTQYEECYTDDLRYVSPDSYQGNISNIQPSSPQLSSITTPASSITESSYYIPNSSSYIPASSSYMSSLSFQLIT